MKQNDRQKEAGNILLALALIRHLYHKGKISECAYKNIKKEYQKKIESTCFFT